jgi:hypothetical protein
VGRQRRWSRDQLVLNEVQRDPQRNVGA